MTDVYIAKDQFAGKKVELSDISIRDGLQSLETIIDTDTKVKYLEGLILAGFKRMEATNYGHPKFVPFFPDATEVLKRLLNSETKTPDGKTIGAMMKRNGGDVELTAVTIHESGAERAFKDFDAGHGPDRILQMTSTCPEHQNANSGKTHDQYFAMTEQVINAAHSRGMVVNGTVSTIWGSPIAGATEMKDAVDFTKRWLEIGATDIEHADHDGSASAPEVFRYFSMILDEIPDTSVHIAHFHETKRVASASILAALHAGICHFEGTLGGLGGQPANFLDDCPVPGTGEYYYEDPRYVGLTCFEDLLVQIDEMSIEHGYNVDRVLWLGRQLERTVGHRLRSEAVINGRTLKEGHPKFARPGLKRLKEKMGESAGQQLPSEWSGNAVLPERYRP